MTFIQNPRHRKYVYGIVLAAIPLLVLFGLITEDEVQVYLNLAAAILGLGSAGLALPNTPSKVHTVDPNTSVVTFNTYPPISADETVVQLDQSLNDEEHKKGGLL